VDPLEVGNRVALSPYRFLLRSNYQWHPTSEQMAEARKLVRPLAEQSFVEQRKDTKLPLVFTYVRRPKLLRGIFRGSEAPLDAATPGADLCMDSAQGRAVAVSDGWNRHSLGHLNR